MILGKWISAFLKILVFKILLVFEKSIVLEHYHKPYNICDLTEIFHVRVEMSTLNSGLFRP